MLGQMGICDIYSTSPFLFWTAFRTNRLCWWITCPGHSNLWKTAIHAHLLPATTGKGSYPDQSILYLVQISIFPPKIRNALLNSVYKNKVWSLSYGVYTTHSFYETLQYVLRFREKNCYKPPEKRHVLTARPNFI